MQPVPPAPTPKTTYAIAEKALRLWAGERLRQEPRPGGRVVYSFQISGSTCSNMGLPIEAVMTVAVDALGMIAATSTQVAPADTGCSAMCVAGNNGERFLAEFGSCEEAVGLTLGEAAFREWDVEASGCFCSAGHRRHKWRNVFQAIHYAMTHAGVPKEIQPTRSTT